MTRIRIGEELVTDPKAAEAFELLRRQRLGNDGDHEFTAQEIHTLFSLSDIPRVSGDTFNAFMYGKWVDNAYQYVRHHHPDLLPRDNVCHDQSCTTTPPKWLTIRDVLVSPTGGVFDLYQPSPSVDEYYIIAPDGQFAGFYSYDCPHIIDHYVIDPEVESNCDNWEKKKVRDPYTIPLPPVEPVEFSFSARVSSSHGTQKDQSPRRSINFDYTYGTPLRNRRAFINREEATLRPARRFVDEAVETLCPSSYPTQEELSASFAYLTYTIPLRDIPPGENVVTFEAEDLFGRTLSTSFSLVRLPVQVGETSITWFGREPPSAEDEVLLARLKELVEAYNREHGVPLHYVHALHDLDPMKNAAADPDHLGISILYSSSLRLDVDELDESFHHDAGGHVGMMDASPEQIARLNDLYTRLFRLSAASKKIRLRNQRGEMRIEFDTLYFPLSGREDRVPVYARQGLFMGIDYTNFDPTKSALYPFKDGHYVSNPEAGHPWDNASELFASTYAILKGGHRDELVNNINLYITGAAHTLALRVVDLVEEIMNHHCTAMTF